MVVRVLRVGFVDEDDGRARVGAPQPQAGALGRRPRRLRVGVLVEAARRAGSARRRRVERFWWWRRRWLIY